MSSATVAGSLQYNLYTTATHATSCGTIAPSRGPPAPPRAASAPGWCNVINHTVYGRLQDSATSQAARPASNYTSTITVTLTY